MSNHRLVYSTETGRICPRCGMPAAQCRCKKPQERIPKAGPVRIRRETQGRRGKIVTVIQGLPALDGAGLAELARLLKQRCGAGGTVEAGTIVIQGDHRVQLQAELEKRGYTVKPAWG